MSVELERFFSQCKLVLTDKRHRLSPYHLEALLYVKVNREFWSAESIEECVLAIRGYNIDDEITNNSSSNNLNDIQTEEIDFGSKPAEENDLSDDFLSDMQEQ